MAIVTRASKGSPLDTTDYDSNETATANLITLSGVAFNAVNLGTFTGTTIPDSSTEKAALQALETAVELRAPIAGPTFTGTATAPALVLSSETASTLASFDASKNVKSLATASYPSLVEIAYVKGVTSAVQTQMNAKAPLASPTFTTLVTLPEAVSAPSLPVYADNAAAVLGGLAVGKIYSTAAGALRVVVA